MADEFKSLGFDFYCPHCDLTQHHAVREMIDHISSKYGRLDFLINNIERGGMPIVHGSYNLGVNTNQWQLEFDTTLKAKWNLFDCAYPLMQKSGSGAVTNISSIAGRIGSFECI